jgi:hypothetical protein
LRLPERLRRSLTEGGTGFESRNVGDVALVGIAVEYVDVIIPDSAVE